MAIEWSDGERVRFQAGGATLEGRMHGPAPEKAATIVMLHQGLGSAELWRDFPDKLSQATSLGVFAYSRQGYGRSDPAQFPRPLDYMEREADVLVEVLDALGADRVILCGHSDGASIACLYLGNHFDTRIRGLALMAPHFFTEPEGLQSIREARDAFEKGDLRERLAKYHQDVDNAFRGWNDAWLDPEFEAWNIGYSIDYVRVPVVAIQGKQDEYGTLAQIKELESRLYSPFDAVILDDCRHSPYLDKPEETLDAVTRFVARLERIEAEDVAVA